MNHETYINIQVHPGFSHYTLYSGWWFGCHQFYFPRNLGLRLSSQLTFIIFFQRVWNINFIFPEILGCFHHPNWRSSYFFRGSCFFWCFCHLRKIMSMMTSTAIPWEFCKGRDEPPLSMRALAGLAVFKWPRREWRTWIPGGQCQKSPCFSLWYTCFSLWYTWYTWYTSFKFQTLDFFERHATTMNLFARSQSQEWQLRFAALLQARPALKRWSFQSTVGWLCLTCRMFYMMDHIYRTLTGHWLV